MLDRDLPLSTPRARGVDLLGLLTLIVTVALVGLLVTGGRDIAQGTNVDLAHGAMLLVPATIAGLLLLQMLSRYV